MFFTCLFGFQSAALAQPILGMAFPPVAESAHREFTIANLRALEIRHIRIAENWKRRGVSPNIEDFAPLVHRIEALTNAGFKILLTVQADGPDVVCDNLNAQSCRIAADAPFEEYLIMLLTAVGANIEAIQFGNEWDHQFAGSFREYTELQNRFAKTVREFDPELPIVLGGITATAPYYYAICEQLADPFPYPNAAVECVQEENEFALRQTEVKWVFAQADYDIIDLHLYDAAGLWPLAVEWVEKYSDDHPIWVTEFGGPHPALEPLDPTYQAERLAVYLNAAKSLPVTRLYYFKLTDDVDSYHSHSGLFTQDGVAKPALEVMREFRPDFGQ